MCIRDRAECGVHFSPQTLSPADQKQILGGVIHQKFKKAEAALRLGGKLQTGMAVSYTHLDVYKRQVLPMPAISRQLAEVGREPEISIAPVFTERPVWSGVGNGWRHLHGSVHGAGVSFEWHNFETHDEFDWGKSFHPGSVEMCLNLAGNGRVAFHRREIAFTPLTAGFYRRGEQPLRATRQAHQRHQFLTVEMSFNFLRQHLSLIHIFGFDLMFVFVVWKIETLP